MNPSSVALLIVLLAFFLLLRRARLASKKSIAEALRRGALVLDVRTPAEFSASHLPGAINLPLSEFEHKLPQQAKDKNKPLLLHCQSGVRSGAAQKIARRLGYTNALNLGSYGRARTLLRTS